MQEGKKKKRRYDQGRHQAKMHSKEIITMEEEVGEK